MRNIFLVGLVAVVAACASHRPASPSSSTARPVRSMADHSRHVCSLGSARLSTARLVDCYDISVKNTPRVNAQLKVYQGEKRRTLKRRLASVAQHLSMMRRELALAGVPSDLAYLPLGLSAEDGRAGLWALDLKTARRYDGATDGWVDPRLDPEMATQIAARYLAALQKSLGDSTLVAAAYRPGSEVVRTATRRAGSNDYWKIGGYLPKAARNDVPRFLATAIIAKHPQRFGMEKLRYQASLRYDLLTVADATSLDELAELAGVSPGTLAALNPALIHGCTPPMKQWDVRVPEGTATKVRDAFFSRPRKFTCQKHVVQKGETLTGLAKLHGMGMTSLQAMNRLRPRQKLAVGQTIAIRTAWKPRSAKAKDFKRQNLPEAFVPDESETETLW